MNKLIIISAPSGCGKTSLIKALLQNRDDFIISISHTTRKKRTGEKNGIDYYFVDKNEFKNLQNNNEFVESAIVFDNFYGTSKSSLQHSLKTFNVIVEIDWQGARQLRKVFDNTINIFIKPPSIMELKNRLQNRGDDKDLIARRMLDAQNEINHAIEYEYQIINDNFNIALQEMNKIL